jgi:hypothetical protein
MCSRKSSTNHPISDTSYSYITEDDYIQKFVSEFSEACLHTRSTADCADHAGSTQVCNMKSHY